MKPYKNREINYSQPVQIYRNLHKNCWSIRQKSKVVAHCDTLNLTQCKFYVNEDGRQWVVANKKKIVHAYVTGFLTDKVVDCGLKVRYNPYQHKQFIVYVNDVSQDIFEAAEVKFTENEVYCNGCK